MDCKMIFIGIDPDVQFSGIGIYNSKTDEISGLKNGFFQTLELIKNYTLIDKVYIVIESGWQNKKYNYHYSKNKYTAERIANNVGRNHQIGMLFEQFCQFYNIDYELKRPDSKKWTSAFLEHITGIKTKNQDIIDAVKLIYKYKYEYENNSTVL